MTVLVLLLLVAGVFVCALGGFGAVTFKTAALLALTFYGAAFVLERLAVYRNTNTGVRS